MPAVGRSVLRRRRRFLPVLIVFILLLPVTASARPGPKIKRADRYARDHLIVKYKRGAGSAVRQAVQARVRGTPVRQFKASGAVLLKLSADADVDEVIDRVRADPNVEYARRDHYLHIHRNIPNDPDFASCWGLDNLGQMLGTPDADIDAPEAWDITTGSTDVIVGLVDTGVDYAHEDLAANMWVNVAERDGAPGVDDDGNGYVDDVHGIQASGGVITGDPYDDHGHGTHCAGIIGAVGNNGIAVVGANWNVRIMALKFLDATGYGLESDAALCLEYAVANGAQILNNSYGGPDDVPELYQAIQTANSAGVLFCTSAGNETNDNDLIPCYPASYDLPNIISVASTGGSDNISYFSNYGATSVDVGAPGEAIWSTWPGDEYQLLDGTSMACPFVVGVAALVKAHEPGLSLPDLRDRVMWTGDWTFDLQETTVTGLRVNAYNALTGGYALRIQTDSPLPDASVGAAYSETLSVTGFAPPYTWTWSEPQYAEREAANGFAWTGAAQGWQSEEGMWQLDLPFSFPFFGGAYDRVYVCSNGYLEFSGSTPLPDSAADIGALTDKRMIAPYWSDLTTDNGFGGLDIFVSSSADSVCVRWHAEEAEWLLGMPKEFSVELFPDGRIAMHYGSENASLVGGVVGISNGDGVNYRVSAKKTNKLDLAWAPSSLWAAGAIPPGLALSTDGEISGTPTAPGNFVFDVHVADSSTGSDTRQLEMKVFSDVGPRADFEGTPLKGNQPLAVQFTDLSTSATGITDWLWNFGDGTTSTLQHPSKTYDNPGFYTVSMTATDSEGTDTMTRFRYVEVFLAGPDVDFSADPRTGGAPLTVQFTDLTVPLTGFDRDIYSWIWDFGDGTWDFVVWPEVSGDIQHTYDTPGTYTVTLEVTDWSGGTGIEVKPDHITVLEPGVTTTTTTSTTTTTTTTTTTLPPTECIVDNQDDFSDKYFQTLSGSWRTNKGGTDRWPIDDQPNATYHWEYAQSDTETARAEWVCTSLSAGDYEVFGWWPNVTYSMGQNIAYEVHHAGGATTVRVDQNASGGQWNTLGTYTFDAGLHVVQIHNGAGTSGSYIIADAVRFLAESGITTTTIEPATTTTEATTTTTTTSSTTTSSTLSTSTTTLPGVECIIDNKDDFSGLYFRILSGSWKTNKGGTDRWPIDDQLNADYHWEYAQSNGETARAEWVCAALAAGDYEVFAWWPNVTYSMGQNVPYEIHHASGATTVRVDQNSSGGQWNSLGAYTFDAGSHVVQIHNGASAPGSYIIADAVRFVGTGSATTTSTTVSSTTTTTIADTTTTSTTTTSTTSTTLPGNECIVDNEDTGGEKYFQALSGSWKTNKGGTDRWPIDDQPNADYHWEYAQSGGETARAECGSAPTSPAATTRSSPGGRTSPTAWARTSRTRSITPAARPPFASIRTAAAANGTASARTPSTPARTWCRCTTAPARPAPTSSRMPCASSARAA